MFSDERFAEACRELQSPMIGDYEFFTESHDVKIYRNYREESGLYEYKIFGSLKDVSPEICKQVYMDLDYRKEWDGYVKELREVSEGEKHGVYWQVKFPFPMSNRDYVYMRELREFDIDSRHIWVIIGQSELFMSEPEVNGVIRVDDFCQSLAIESDGDGGTQAFMYYYDNPKGMIPTWLINWGAKTGVPKFLTDMEKACKEYEDYLKAKKQ